MNKFNKWAESVFKEGDFDKISHAVTLAEKISSAEIVTMVVRSSSVRGPIFLSLSMTLFSILLALVFVEGPESSVHSMGWLLGVFLLSIIGAWLGMRSPILIRWVQAPSDLSRQVFQRAELEFYRLKLNETHSNTAVLLMVSLLEKQVVVLADPKISQRIPYETWPGVVKDVIQGIQKGSLSEGMCSGILKLSEILKEVLPPDPNKMNEVSNQLILKE